MATVVQADEFRYREPVSIGAQLHRHLRDAIIRADLKPGQALSETEVSKRYAVSRQPVREAFIKLAEERLVEVLPQRGTFVVKISIDDVMDARFVREVIEVAIVQEVALSATPALVAQLRDLLEQQRAVGGDNERFLALDESFHKLLAGAVRRDHAWRVVENVKAQMDRVRYLSIEDATPMSIIVEQHTRIVDAIEAGDALAAAAAMRTHLREILKSLPEIAQNHPDIFEPSSAPLAE
ncbi:GntR family transcriptional regulator [Uliginosibacterium sp. sgz301328]|uniref:GntR family transcriptional regulator n=1 Tax=Uliginosibacterium sp. sgz301328 TaxID=3243764 RepID=UPI00359E807A